MGIISRIKQFFNPGTSSTALENKVKMSINPNLYNRVTGKPSTYGMKPIKGSMSETTSRLVYQATPGLIPEGRVASAGRSIANTGKALYGRLFAPTSLKQVAIGTGLASAGYGLSKYAFTGKPSDLLAGPRAVSEMMSLRISPVASLLGTVHGAFGSTKNALMSFMPNMSKANNPLMPSFNFPQIPNIKDYFSGFQMPSITYPSMGFNPSYSGGSNNIVVGGGGGGDLGILPYLLLGGLGMGAGYLMGRRKKRKKYKGRKHRK